MRKLLISLVFVLGVSVPAVVACGCPDMPGISFADKIKGAVKNADAVFLGKVDRFEWVVGVPNVLIEMERENIPGLTWESKTVVFKPDRLWKGSADPDIVVATDSARRSDGISTVSSCDYQFEEGKTYLVFAHQEGWYLKTGACSLTRREDQIKEILPVLGPGKKPVKRVE